MVTSQALWRDSQQAGTRLIAFYLPQYHPIAENDAWWGPGFTEWRNVVKAKPQFPGHQQPHLPGELGFYDLRLAEVRAAQAELARAHGLEGFCYYHYWFNGHRLLHRPMDEIMRTGEPDFPFCLCWANENWTRAWDGRSREVLIEQFYSPEDDLNHIRHLAPILADPRYIRVNGKAMLLIYRASLLPQPQRTLETWRQEAERLGVGELFLARVQSFHEERSDPRTLGFDTAVDFQPDWQRLHTVGRRMPIVGRMGALIRPWRGYVHHRVYDYQQVVAAMLSRPAVNYPRLPCVTPRWDNTARRRRDAVILHGSTPTAYAHWLRRVIAQQADQADAQRIVFINAWNEWAEGNHLEPDECYGRGYLQATREVLGEMHTAAALP